MVCVSLIFLYMQASTVDKLIIKPFPEVSIYSHFCVDKLSAKK